MKVLFLDVDGVLNMHGNASRLYSLNKRRLRNLQRVVEATGCKIVLSSTWRRDPPGMQKLRHVLSYRGMTLYSVTPKIEELDDVPVSAGGIILPYQERGREIRAWLNDHPDVTRYAIVDDDSDFLPEQKEFFVKTEGYKGGLTEERAQALIDILNKE